MRNDKYFRQAQMVSCIESRTHLQSREDRERQLF